MKTKLFLILFIGMTLFSCSKKEHNPLVESFNTPFQTPPFNKIETKHYMPAIMQGIKQHNIEIDAIVKNTEAPTFENTFEALDRSGALLSKVNNIFSSLNGANTNEEFQKIAREIAPLLSKHYDEILLNDELFQKIKSVYLQKDKLNLDVEQNTLLTKYFKDFVRGGANLNEANKIKLKEINGELSSLSVKFSENILKDNNAFRLIIKDKKDLAGLPESVISNAFEAAKDLKLDNSWVFTLQKPSLIPFLQFSSKRNLREKIFKAYTHRGDNNNEFDNKSIAVKMANLRLEKANILGYKSHADLILENNMAQKSENVYALLNKIWKPALKMAKKERNQLQSIIYKEGGNFKLQPWDWSFYAEKLKKQKYDFDEELMRPYFKLENVRNAAFMVANKLYGYTFTERDDIAVYQKDVKVFELKDSLGQHIGVFYTDYYSRDSKRGGAWMDSFVKQSNNGERIYPIIYNVCNFTKPIGDKPCLLSFEEVTTLFHEFGHALHGLSSNCKYKKLSGTAVSRDFVELPSQIMENWPGEPEVLKTFAKHYKTGEIIPQQLIDKFHNASHFNQGFATVEYLAASFLDMDWHTITEPVACGVDKFEEKTFKKIGLIPEIVSRYRTPYYRHIFASGYSAGYYSYIWAEVIDADAFQYFKDNGIFNKKIADSFKNNLISRGGTENPMILYKRFRGSEPKIEALLKRKGF